MQLTLIPDSTLEIFGNAASSYSLHQASQGCFSYAACPSCWHHISTHKKHASPATGACFACIPLHACLMQLQATSTSKHAMSSLFARCALDQCWHTCYGLKLSQKLSERVISECRLLWG